MQYGGSFNDSLNFSYITSDTIRGKIVNMDNFKNGTEGEVLIGSLSALTGGALWLIAATAAKLPVSSTHSIVGAMMGFGLVAFGIKAIRWKEFVKIGMLLMLIDQFYVIQKNYKWRTLAWNISNLMVIQFRLSSWGPSSEWRVSIWNVSMCTYAIACSISNIESLLYQFYHGLFLQSWLESSVLFSIWHCNILFLRRWVKNG